MASRKLVEHGQIVRTAMTHYIDAYIRHHQRSPSLDELAAEYGLSRTQTRNHVELLIERGVLIRDRGHRTLRLRRPGE